MHLEPTAFQRGLTQFLQRGFLMAERRVQIDEPEAIAALPFGRSQPRIRSLQAGFRRLGEIGPRRKRNDAVAGTELAILPQHDGRQHHPFEVGEEDVSILRHVHHQPHRMAKRRIIGRNARSR